MSSFWRNVARTGLKAKCRRVIEQACQSELRGIAEGLESRLMLSNAPGPWVLSINGTSPSGSIISSSTTSASYTVTFSGAVTGVAPSDFSIPTTGDVADTGLVITPISSSIYTATINGISGRGTIGLNLVDNGAITDLSGDPLQTNPGGPITLQTPATYAAGNYPSATALGDLNGDGKPDLAVDNFNSDTLGVFLNNGNGTFGSQTTYTLPGQSNEVAIADLNSDGHPDLIAAGGSAIWGLLNNGNGTFQAPYTIAGNIPIAGMTVADLNGDGIPDIIWASYSTTNLVHVMIGNGNGTFKAPVTYAIQASYGTLTVADLSNGKPDLIVGGEGVSDIDVLLNNGNGTFAPAFTLATGYAPSSYTVADVNGDGVPDIIVANEGDGTGNNGNTVSVLLGNSNGTFKPQVTYADGSEPYGIQAADFNGDGKLDLVNANFKTGTISVLEGNGDGTFQAQETFTAGQSPEAPIVADINGDKRPDIVLPVSGADEVEVFLGAVDSFAGTTYTRQMPYLSVAVQPTNVEAGLDDYISVDVETPQGTLNTNDASPVTLTISSGKFGTGITTQTVGAVGGVATFQQMYIYKTGTYTLSVTDPGDDPTTTNPFTITPGPFFPSTFTVTTNPTQIDPGRTSTITLTAFDYYNNPGTGQSVSFAETGSGTSAGTIGPVTDNGDGTYTATFTATTSGTPRAIATTFDTQVLAQKPTITVDTPPVVTSITRQTPSMAETSAGSVSYAVTFSQPVTGVTSSCFEVIDTGSVATSPTVAVTGSGANYVVTVNGIHGSGTVQLELVDKDQISNSGVFLGGTGIGNGSFVAPAYIVDQAAPTLVSIARSSPAGGAIPQGSTTASYTVTFSNTVTGVVPSDFAIPTTGALTDTGCAVTPVSGSVYTVTVNGISGVGTVGLNFADNAAVRDSNGNPLQTTVTAASFSTANTYSLSAFPNPLAIADLNGDGHPDFVSINSLSGSNTVNVVLSTGNNTYAAPQTYAVGRGPLSVTIADVNGDGIPDLIVLNAEQASGSGPANVGILLGNGDGTFKAEMTTACGSSPEGLIAADLNHDGKLDLILATDAFSGPDGFDVLMGNGDGTFKPAVTYGSLISGVPIVADINNDGNLDVIAVTGSNQVSIYPGNGDGTFQSPKTFSPNLPSGDSISALVAADLNGDGNLDLAAAISAQPNGSSFGNEMGVFPGNGNFTFQPSTTYAVSNYPLETSVVGISAGDVNQDGSLDLVVTNQDGADLTLFMNNGNGTFQAQQTISAGGQEPYLAQFADINGDGRPDLVTTYTSVVGVLLNQSADNVTGPVDTNGPSYLAFAQQPVNQIAGTNLNSVAVDIDDSSGNVLAGNQSSVTLTLSSGHFADGNTSETVAAVNGVATFSTLNIKAALSSYTLTATDGTFVQAVSNPFQISPVPINPSQGVMSVSLAIVDVNATSTITLNEGTDVYGNPEWGQGVVFYLGATGTSYGTIGPIIDHHDGTYTATFTATEAGTAKTILALTNGNADTPTAAVTVAPLATLSISKSNPLSATTGANSVTYTVTFSEPVTGVDSTVFSVPTTGSVTDSGVTITPVSGSVYTATINGIAGIGTIGLNFNGNTKVRDLQGQPLQANISAGAFGSPVLYDQSTAYTPTYVATADLNGDHIPDLVVVAASELQIYLGNGNGTFKSPLIYGIGVEADYCDIADINGDGIPDILVANGYQSTTVSVFLGNGDGTFRAAPSVTVGETTSQIVVGDFNGDGKPDLLGVDTTGTSNNAFSLCLGNGDGTFQPQRTFAANGVWAMAAADINGDGHLDIVADDGAHVSAFMGNGDGTFQAQKTLVAVTGADPLVIGDVNGDGIPDIIVSAQSGATYTLDALIGNGDGTFKTPTQLGSGLEGNGLALVDLNGDGKPDLLVSNASATPSLNNLTVLMGNGNGTFQAAKTYAVNGQPQSIVVADFNSDGRPDAITADIETNDISELLGSESTILAGPTYTIVPLITTSVAVTSNNNPSTYGQSVTLTATVTPTSGNTETGTVQFMDGATDLGSPATLAGGVATYITSSLGAGGHTITAVYSGDPNYSGNTSPAVTQTVNQATPTINTLSPVNLTYGTALANSQIASDSASVPGTFTYTSAAGSVPSAGNGQTDSVTFTPSDTTDYKSVTTNVTVNVAKATPNVVGVNPVNITYGTLTANPQLSGTAQWVVNGGTVSVAGAFTYVSSGNLLIAGNGQTQGVTFTPTDTVDYTNASSSVTVNVAKGTPTGLSVNPVNITYGTLLANGQLSGSAHYVVAGQPITVIGTVTYTSAAGTLLGAGNGQSENITFTPGDTLDLMSIPGTVTVNVAQATPTNLVVGPVNLTYGTALANSQLAGGTAGVPGTFAYAAAGTVLGAGNGQNQAVTFTPTDAIDYSSVAGSVTVNVAKATPIVMGVNPVNLTFGTLLDNSQLSGSAQFTVGGSVVAVAGAFSYVNDGTLLTAGNGQSQGVTFTPADTADYVNASSSVTVNVAKATPTGLSVGPVNISYGNLLANAQLSGTAHATVAGLPIIVFGTVTYTSAAGTLLNAGNGQSENVTFTPDDTLDFNNITGTVTVNVSQALTSIQNVGPVNITYGTALDNSQLSGGAASVPGTFTYTSAAGSVLGAGNGQTEAVTFTPTDAADYAGASGSVTVNVAQATPVIGSVAPVNITYATPLANSQLSGTATYVVDGSPVNVQGTYTYTSAAGTVLSPGNGQTEAVTFTPADTVDYTTASSTVVVNVAQDTVVGISVGWGGRTAPLFTAADGLRLLPAGRNTDLPWQSINKFTITLNTPASLTAADVSVTGMNIANYGPVTISGSGTTYTINLGRTIWVADRVTITIGNAGIATYTRRIDVLPGDVNDDGKVNALDEVLERNAMRGINGATPTVFTDISGDDPQTMADYTIIAERIGTQMPMATVVSRSKPVVPPSA